MYWSKALQLDAGSYENRSQLATVQKTVEEVVVGGKLLQLKENVSWSYYEAV